jgi:hypothetical protein
MLNFSTIFDHSCRIPGGFCQPKLLQITAEKISRFSMRLLPLAEAAYLVSIVIDLHFLYTLHCTLCRRRGLNIAFLLDTLSAIYPGVCSLKEWCNTPGSLDAITGLEWYWWNLQAKLGIYWKMLCSYIQWLHNICFDGFDENRNTKLGIMRK